MPSLLDVLSEDVEWVYQGPSVIPFAGTRHGREGVVEFFSLLGESLEFEQFELREFVAQDDRVVVVGFERNLIKATGRTFEQEWVHDFTLRDGKISKVRSFEDTAAYVAALEPA
jgi:ketosteroid isomerase-like protein